MASGRLNGPERLRGKNDDCDSVHDCNSKGEESVSFLAGDHDARRLVNGVGIWPYGQQ